MNGAMEDSSACVVSSSVSLFLRVSRLAGLAPVSLHRKGDGFRVALSRPWAVYGHCVITVINLLTLVPLVAELQLPAEGTVRMRSETRRVVWTVQSCFMVLVSGVAVYGAPAQMRDSIACYNQVHKINAELNIVQWPSSLSRLALATLGTQATVCVVFSIINYTQTLISASHINEAAWINALYICYFLSYWILQLWSLQFNMLVLHVKYSFSVVNSQLHDILEDIENVKNVPYSREMVKVIEKYSIERLDSYIRFSNSKADSGVGGWKTSGEQVAVRRLALVFAALCGVVRAVDRSHGLMVLLMLANFLLHLICTPYYFITYLLDDESQARLTPLNIVAIAMQLLWCVYHTLNLVSIIEPCHLTHAEMSRTRQLVGHLARCPRSTHDPLALELEQFFRYLALNHVHYEPLRFAKMTRALVFTLLGSITTYTVVILHF